MLQVTNKNLKDAKAGNYETPNVTTRIKSGFMENRAFKPDTLSLEEVVLLDISFYQRTCHFPTALSNGIKGTIIRAGQNLWEDTCADTFMKDAIAANMPIGSYWFYDSRVDPKEQADLWKKVLKDYPTQLFCWADYEENYGGKYKGWRHFYDFLERCKLIMPNRKFGIYTGFYYWISNSPNPVTEASALNYFAQYPLWLAWYSPDVSTVRIPKPWTNMTFWQKTAKGDGTKYGVGSLNVDVNQFIGTQQEYETMFKLGEIGGEMPEITYTGTVKNYVTAGAIVRATPNGADTGQRLLANTQIQVQGSLVQAGIHTWANVVSPLQGWVADILLDLVPVQEPQPEPTLPATVYIGTTPTNGVKYVREE